MFGMDPLNFLRTDGTTRTFMQGIARAGREIQRQHDLERAQMIAKEVSRLFGKRG